MIGLCMYRVSKKIPILWKNGHNYLQTHPKKLGVFWKIQDICYQIGTEIFKIEEEMTEKMKPEVANPPPKMGRIHCSHYALI